MNKTGFVFFTIIFLCFSHSSASWWNPLSRPSDNLREGAREMAEALKTSANSLDSSSKNIKEALIEAADKLSRISVSAEIGVDDKTLKAATESLKKLEDISNGVGSQLGHRIAESAHIMRDGIVTFADKMSSSVDYFGYNVVEFAKKIGEAAEKLNLENFGSGFGKSMVESTTELRMIAMQTNRTIVCSIVFIAFAFLMFSLIQLFGAHFVRYPAQNILIITSIFVIAASVVIYIALVVYFF
jgi:hypothetical protein